MDSSGVAAGIERQDHGHTAVLTLTGEVDVYGAPALREQLVEVVSEGFNLIIDLTHIEYLDSTGMGVFVGILKRARSHGLNVVVIYGTNTRIRSVFTITGLVKVFTIAETVDEALTLLDPATTASPAP